MFDAFLFSKKNPMYLFCFNLSHTTVVAFYGPTEATYYIYKISKFCHFLQTKSFGTVMTLKHTYTQYVIKETKYKKRKMDSDFKNVEASPLTTKKNF